MLSPYHKTLVLGGVTLRHFPSITKFLTPSLASSGQYKVTVFSPLGKSNSSFQC